MAETIALPPVIDIYAIEAHVIQNLQDRFVRLARSVFEVPYAILWIDQGESPQIIVCTISLDRDETQAMYSLIDLCKDRQICYFEDMLLDNRLADHLAVSKNPGIRCFAQACCSPGEHPTAGICVFDTQPGHKIGEKELHLLQEIAEMASLGWMHGDAQFSIAGKTAQQANIAGVPGAYQGISEREQVSEALQRAQALAVLEERQRLARDLHDAVSQTLWAASIIAEVLPALWNKDQEDGQRSLEHLRRLTQGALAEMRTLLLELRPAALVETKLNDLLLQLAQAMMGREKVTITLDMDDGCALPADVQVSIYRIAQESLNNIAKHSQASQVKMTLRSTPTWVNLHIQDNGLGFDPKMISPRRLGLEIMRERAQAIHAQLNISSEIGQGTEIFVEWPDRFHTEIEKTL